MMRHTRDTIEIFNLITLTDDTSKTPNFFEFRSHQESHIHTINIRDRIFVFYPVYSSKTEKSLKIERAEKVS